MEKIELLILDVDGILTDGKKNYTINGEVIGKSFPDIDFTALKMFKAMGIDVVLITGDANNLFLSEKRNLETIISRSPNGKILDKGKVLRQIAKDKNVQLKKIWFAGDDVFDIAAMKEAGYVSVPSNALPVTKSFANIEIDAISGEYFVSKMLERYLESHPITDLDSLLMRVEELDAMEASSADMNK